MGGGGGKALAPDLKRAPLTFLHIVCAVRKPNGACPSIPRGTSLIPSHSFVPVFGANSISSLGKGHGQPEAGLEDAKTKRYFCTPSWVFCQATVASDDRRQSQPVATRAPGNNSKYAFF